MRKIVLVFMLSVGPVLSATNDFTAYYSPGIQLGYSFSHDLFISVQISVGVGYRDNLVFPGVTLGIRRYPSLTAIYMDAQLAIFFMGLGRGITYVKPGRGYINKIPTGLYRHVKFWGAFFAYDHIRTSRHNPIKNHSMIYVAPKFIHGRSWIFPPDDENEGWF